MELNVSIPIVLSPSGKVTCKGLEATEESNERNEVFVTGGEEPMCSLSSHEATSPLLSPGNDQTLDTATEKDTRLDFECSPSPKGWCPDPSPDLDPILKAASPRSTDHEAETATLDELVVHDYASEEVVHSSIHHCSEDDVQECVKQIVLVSEKMCCSLQQQESEKKGLSPTPMEVGGEFQLDLNKVEEEIIYLEEGEEDDVINEVTVLVDQGGDEMNTVDLIKLELEQNTSEDIETEVVQLEDPHCVQEEDLHCTQVQLSVVQDSCATDNKPNKVSEVSVVTHSCYVQYHLVFSYTVCTYREWKRSFI